MTRSRVSTTTIRGLGFMWAAAAASLLGGCAALPGDAPIVEQLDSETGTTVTRLGHPVELYRETFQQETAGRFAFIGPFETNSMGKRESYLWLAVPVEPMTDAVPSIEINGTALSLASPGRSADFANVHISPYKIPTPWSAMYYFRVDDAVLTRLAEATNVAVRVLEPGKNGPIKALFAVKLDADTRFKDFAGR